MNEDEFAKPAMQAREDVLNMLAHYPGFAHWWQSLDDDAVTEIETKIYFKIERALLRSVIDEHVWIKDAIQQFNDGVPVEDILGEV